MLAGILLFVPSPSPQIQKKSRWHEKISPSLLTTEINYDSLGAMSQHEQILFEI